MLKVYYILSPFHALFYRICTIIVLESLHSNSSKEIMRLIGVITYAKRHS